MLDQTMSDDDLETMVWAICYLREPEKTCRHCPLWEIDQDGDTVRRGCVAHCIEIINTVQTGNPWRKPLDAMTLAPRTRGRVFARSTVAIQGPQL